MRSNEIQTTGHASPPRRRDEQSSATREALVTAAERLFAEHGVHAVSNRQISEAAGQGNNTAVSYHFGSKEALVRSIVGEHADAIHRIRERRISEIQDPDDLRSWVSVAVRSITEHLEGLGRPSWYARLIAQVAADPALHGIDSDDEGARASLRTLRDGMTRCLPDLPADVERARSTMTRHLINQTTVDRERALAEATDSTPGTWDDVADDLVDAIVAIWRAPVSGEATKRAEHSPDAPDAEWLAFAHRLREDFARFMMTYRFGVDEILTKVHILRQEFLHLHRYNPIEHVSSRVKSPRSILEKALRRGIEPSLPSIREHISDIAGVRVTCSFIADTYRLLDALTSQDDVHVIEVKDYIARPKANGYKSLHAIVEIPVFLSTGPVPVRVEVQIRTIAMDFWASLEHKIFYKYEGAVPGHLAADLARAATAAEQLDQRMEQLHTEVHGTAQEGDDEGSAAQIDDALLRQLWERARRTTEGH